MGVAWVPRAAVSPARLPGLGLRTSQYRSREEVGAAGGAQEPRVVCTTCGGALTAGAAWRGPSNQLRPARCEPRSYPCLPASSPATPCWGLPCTRCCHFLSGRNSTFVLCLQRQGKFSLSRLMADVSWTGHSPWRPRGRSHAALGKVPSGLGDQLPPASVTPQREGEPSVFFWTRGRGWRSSCHSDPHAGQHGLGN